jgi:hypothetical protein
VYQENYETGEIYNGDMSELIAKQALLAAADHAIAWHQPEGDDESDITIRRGAVTLRRRIEESKHDGVMRLYFYCERDGEELVYHRAWSDKDTHVSNAVEGENAEDIADRILDVFRLEEEQSERQTRKRKIGWQGIRLGAGLREFLGFSEI